jgi:hypothetical protein
MRKILLILFIFGITAALDDMSVPNTFSLPDTLEAVFVRAADLRDGTFDTISMDTSYSRVAKARIGRIDTTYGDTAYYRVAKARNRKAFMISYLILALVIVNSVLIITTERRIVKKIMVRGNRRLRKINN